MTLVKKLILTGGGLVLLFPASVGLIRIMSGHDEPIVVDNPKMSVNFGFLGHRMNVKPGNDGRAEELSRDITTVKEVSIQFRKGNPAIDVDTSKPVTFEDSKQDKLEISIKANQAQLLVKLPGRQFGECLDSWIYNRCFAKEDDRRLRTVRYTDLEGTPKHKCLNDGKDIPEGNDQCLPAANEARAGLSLKFTKE